MPSRPVRIAVEGCGHGTLHAIYASLENASKLKGWENGPDLVIIGGDFQAVRNADDLKAMSVPPKYREIGDFHEYYSGARMAPYLTVFIGGNHEASNHLFELYYGGWAAPNIYYLGAANVLRFGPLRIAGLSGIWKGYNYRKPHFERLPYTSDDIKSIYHVREIDVRKLLQIRSQVDIGISHDWPKGVEWLGEWTQLFRFKPHFEEDAHRGTLGSVAARHVLDHLRPKYWFSAHLHCKYSAVVEHVQTRKILTHDSFQQSMQPTEVNEDEIDVSVGDHEEDHASATEQSKHTSSKDNSISEDLRQQLPDTFKKQLQQQDSISKVPELITNTTTQFLALDKCLPRRRFLQLLEVPVDTLSTQDSSGTFPLVLSYDPEWLSINRVFAKDLHLGDRSTQLTPNRDYTTEIQAAREWVNIHIVDQGLLAIPMNFELTAPIYDARQGDNNDQMPIEYTNPQTSAFCSMLDIPNPFRLSDEERQARRIHFFAPDGGMEEQQKRTSHGHRFHTRGRRGQFKAQGRRSASRR